MTAGAQAIVLSGDPLRSFPNQFSIPITQFRQRGLISLRDSIQQFLVAHASPPPFWGRPSGFRLPGNTAVWVKSLTGDGPLKVLSGDICLIERIEQHVPDRILQPPCFLRRDNVALLVLPYPFKSGELRLELRYIPSQFLLHFVGSELSAGILGSMGTCSLAI